MSKRYKLVINNHHKHLITEALEDHTFEDTQNFLKNIFKLISNTTQAVIVLVGAQTEYLTLATTFANKISIKKITETFVKKIEFANKLFDEAISDNVRADVDMLYAINNPAFFIGKKLLGFITEDKEKNLEMYIPYWWFIKDIVAGDFFKTEVEEFGNLFGGKFKNNTIIWWYGWFAQDLIMGSKQFLQESLQEGLFEKFETFQGVKSIEELKTQSPSIAKFLVGFEAFEILTGSTRELYNFLRRNEDSFNKIAYYKALIMTGNNRKSFFINYKFLQNQLLIKKKKFETLSKNGENVETLQLEITQLEQKLNKAKNMTFQDSTSGANKNVNDLESLEQSLDEEYIKIYDEAGDEKETVIEALIGKYKAEDPTDNRWKRLSAYKDILQKSAGKKYASEKMSVNESEKEAKLLEIHRSLEEFENLLTAADQAYAPEATDDPQKMYDEVFSKYSEDLKETIQKMHAQNVAIIPDLLQATLGDNANEVLFEFLNTFYSSGKEWVKDTVGFANIQSKYEDLMKKLPF